MRIIGGIRKGQKLLYPKDKRIRPKTDRVKVAIFNIIGDFFAGSDVLDLFAGSGSLGLEAISRGARSCYFVDNDTTSVNTIKKNVQKLKFAKKAQVFRLDVFRSISFFEKKKIKFALIFIDPPFRFFERPTFKKKMAKFLEAISKSPITSNQSLIVVGHRKDVNLSKMNSLETIDRRIYSNTGITIFKPSKIDKDKNNS